jgi:hypothetical protein
LISKQCFFRYVSTGILLLTFTFTNVCAQSAFVKTRHKGSWFFYWGWNRAAYTASDITFHGNTFDFEIKHVKAKDKPSPFNAGLYFNPGSMTIPQYNFRVGYFLNDHYSISFGADHMKYVMVNNQTVKMTGTIHDTETQYNGVYDDDDIVLTEDFLLFEHTDGLNYENLELRRFDALYERKNFSINMEEGVGVGFMYPRTNTTLLHNPRNDEFHLSGYGLNAVVALNLTFWRHFFIQSELKGGFINMPDIRITNNEAESASQHFFFTQYNFVMGARIALGK